MAKQKTRSTPSPQIPLADRLEGDVYEPGKSGITIIRKGKRGKKRRINLNTIVKQIKKKE